MAKSSSSPTPASSRSLACTQASSVSLPSAKLSRDGRPPNSCCFGAGVMSREEASDMLAKGMAAPLIITNARGESGHYWLSLLLHNGIVMGYRLIEDTPEGVMYDIPADLSSCECPAGLRYDTTCKHRRCVQALKATGRIK